MRAVQVESALLLVPEADDGKGYPGRIRPGWYTRNQVAALLRKHKHDPDAIQFMADMLEE